MRTIFSIKELQKEIASRRKNGERIGLVPTMGALHQGHLSLVETASKQSDCIVVTIFVNPTQFNDPKDLQRYPRNLENDLELLKPYGVDIVFSPEVSEMYPEQDQRSFDLHPLDSVMEGEFRPGHFNGVAQIVSKLFDAAKPDLAFFGLKDFQQLAIIKKMTADLGFNIEIVPCAIVREKDGLAMSSRNSLLETEHRKAAPHIYKTLQKAVKIQAKSNPNDIRAFITKEINKHPLMEIEYFEIVNDQSLMPISTWDDASNKIGCIAVHINKIRLIDNIYFA